MTPWCRLRPEHFEFPSKPASINFNFYYQRKTRHSGGNHPRYPFPSCHTVQYRGDVSRPKSSACMLGLLGFRMTSCPCGMRIRTPGCCRHRTRSHGWSAWSASRRPGCRGSWSATCTACARPWALPQGWELWCWSPRCAWRQWIHGGRFWPCTEMWQLMPGARWAWAQLMRLVLRQAALCPQRQQQRRRQGRPRRSGCSASPVVLPPRPSS